MTATVAGDLVVSGALSAANILFGTVTISPQTNEPTTAEVKTNHVGTNEPIVLLTAHSGYPWTRVREVSYRFAAPTGFNAYIYRTTDSETSIHWVSWQPYSPYKKVPYEAG